MSYFQPFVMERMMSKYEQEVEFNMPKAYLMAALDRFHELISELKS